MNAQISRFTSTIGESGTTLHFPELKLRDRIRRVIMKLRRWTMGVTLMPDIAARLHESAARTGVNENEMANALLATALDLEGLGSETEIAAISEGLRACDEGRE